MNEMEEALRASLERNARQAPPGDLLAERIILRADQPQPAPHRRLRWRTWALPVLASASVAAVVIGVAATSDLSHDASGGPGSSNSVSVSVPPNPSSTAVVPPPVISNPPIKISTPPTNSVGLTGFRAVDLTFVGPTEGWALGTANCLSGKGICTAMVHTTDGTHWTSMPNPPVNVGPSDSCADPCAPHIRFATDKIGYAYGDSALFMTTDGRHWTQQPGGALALETLDQNVIRVVSNHSGCPGPCDVQVQTAPIGSTHWTTRDLGRPLTAETDGVGPLARSGSSAYLLFTGHTSGGAQGATSHLFVSSNDGATWTDRGEPCRQPANGEIDSTTITTAAGGTLVVGCVNRTTQAASVTVSTDGGTNFSQRPSFSSAGLTLVAAASDKMIFAMSDVLYRSSDGGQHFAKVQQNSQGPLGASWIGFESPSTGHVLEYDGSPDSGGSTIWTTTDAGADWSSYTFP